MILVMIILTRSVIVFMIATIVTINIARILQWPLCSFYHVLIIINIVGVLSTDAATMITITAAISYAYITKKEERGWRDICNVDADKDIDTTMNTDVDVIIDVGIDIGIYIDRDIDMKRDTSIDRIRDRDGGRERDRDRVKIETDIESIDT